MGRCRPGTRSEEHTSELQSRGHLVCRLLLEKKKIVLKSRYAHPVSCRGGGPRGLADRGVGPERPTASLPRRQRRLFFFNDTATTEIYTLSLHDALPISWH